MIVGNREEEEQTKMTVPSQAEFEFSQTAFALLAHDRPPGDLAQAARMAALDELAGFAPTVRAAVNLLGLSVPVVPLDPGTLRPSGDPIGLDAGESQAVAAALAWWRDRPGDGVGLETGPKGGYTLVGVHEKPAGSVAGWLLKHGVDEQVVPWDQDPSRSDVRRVGRPVGGPALVRWVPPAGPNIRVTQRRGGAAEVDMESRRAVRPDPEVDARGRWVLWVAPAGLAFRRRDLGGGLSVLADGSVVPWSARLPDGWRVDGNGPVTWGLLPDPHTAVCPPWLVAAFGGKAKVAA